MMQVYEYFISHHMAKAFESLFGSVTCLPGCFTLFRLRTADTNKPLLISNQMISDYSQNRVDTLHMKNLLHLGEDRYLTTLLLKHFPMHKTQFIRDAHAYTVAPDDWKILLSQRRRWINSTVHNLGELMFLDQLCGFCCFSMRFIVMMDLVSTLIQPVTVAYVRVFFGFILVLAHASCGIDRLLDRLGRWRGKHHSHHLAHHDWRRVRSSSTRVYPSTQVGHGWLDGVLHPRHSHLFVYASHLLLLAYGRFLMGCDPCRAGRVWQEDYRTCALGSRFVVALMLTTYLDRTKASLIPGRFLSRRGTTTRMSCGTRSPTTRAVPGFRLAINTRKATPSHGRLRCTDTRRFTNLAASLLRHRNNLACYRATNRVVPPPCRNSAP